MALKKNLACQFANILTYNGEHLMCIVFHKDVLNTRCVPSTYYLWFFFTSISSGALHSPLGLRAPGLRGMYCPEHHQQCELQNEDLGMECCLLCLIHKPMGNIAVTGKLSWSKMCMLLMPGVDRFLRLIGSVERFLSILSREILRNYFKKPME